MNAGYYNPQKEKVTIMMSTYNGEKYVDEQLKSISLQNDVEVKMLIRDDGSTDTTMDIVDKWKDKIDISAYVGENAGSAMSFMDLLKSVQYDENSYYAFSDQDDYWFSDKMKNAIGKIRPFSDIPALYFSNVKCVGPKLEDIYNPFTKRFYGTELSETLIVGGAPGCTMVFNSSLMKAVKRYFPEKVFMHDLWLLNVCASLDGKIIYDPEPSMMYRQHEDNVISALGRIKENRFALLNHRIRKFFNYRYKPTEIAKNLLSGFEKDINRDKKTFLFLLVDSKKHLLKRLKVAFSANRYTGYKEYNFKFAVQTILNKH